MANHANSIRDFGQVGDIFELTNDAQKGGSFSSILIPFGTLFKVSSGAAKAMRATKELEVATDTAKTANIASNTAKTSEAAKTSKTTEAASDVNKAPETGGPNGGGGKIKAAPKMKQHKPKCFKPGDKLKEKYKNDPKKMEKEFYKQLKAQEDGINKMTVGKYTENRGILNDLTEKYGHEKARRILTQGGKEQEAARNKLSKKFKIQLKNL